MTINLKPFPGAELQVEGTYKPGEAEVGIPESFEIARMTSKKEDISDLLEWAASRGKYGDFLRQVEELCLENIY